MVGLPTVPGYAPRSVGLALSVAAVLFLLGGLVQVNPIWTIGDSTLVPNPFWGGVAFPLVVFLVLLLWPSLERMVTGDRAFHNLLDRPRDAPWRTAIGAALLTWVFLVF